MKNKKYVLFDFDGVIVDSFALCLEVSRSLQPGKFEDPNDYRRLFHGNIYEALGREPDDKSVIRLEHPSQKRYYELYLPRILELEPVAGIQHVLQELIRNYGLIVLSSTLSAPVAEYLDKYNLRHYFLEIMGADVHHSKQEKVRMVYEKFKTSSEHCVFVTDTLGDLREATKVRLRSVAVTWGFHRVHELEQGSPIAIVNTPKELLQTVHGLFDKL